MKSIVFGFVFASAYSGCALAQAPEAYQQQALATIKQYALDMTIVLPCMHMASEERVWGKNYGEAELNKVLAQYEKRGATRAQIEALRKVFNANFQPKWVQDIRVAARACVEDKIFYAIATMGPPATPLTLRAPFNNTP